MWGITIVLPLLLSYLIGSVSFSYFIAKRMQNIDIREHGSGNAGATNTLRVLGKGPAAFVFVLDALKGMSAVGVAMLLNTENQTIWMLAGVLAVVGHNWPVYLGFRGGKGIATTIGVTVLLSFTAAIIAGVLAILFIVISRYVSLGSLVYTAGVPIGIAFDSYPNTYLYLSLVLTALAVYRHRENLKNLFQGKERKI
ncbi:glycerol-3-phosphate 1-O-acyltransferase PlsY [Risungbinella massiliensis]|uniref:glycerol-3-phosphate 1-O-acyltransferase PlsY n=1 Tax=Risungbinella massiliensis TaxID=1329796 RepID=UPI0005CC1094|nr:glycerol-3-phosphate 1-O-acyltransferase PlsY [Risungbinella massiliensis]